MVPFAMELANRISLRLEHHNSLTSFEIEDIEQELLTYVLERASQFDPAKGSIEAFVTQMMRTAAARLIRGSNRRRSNPPPGRVVDSLSKMVERAASDWQWSLTYFPTHWHQLRSAWNGH
jgi:DNA-directed RNA polymerase specialized sigma24 family protein